MTNYKYENVEHVEARKDFKVYNFDVLGEPYEIATVRQGTKGIVESMGCRSLDGFRNNYDILFKESDGNEIDVSIYEDKMDELLIFL